MAVLGLSLIIASLGFILYLRPVNLFASLYGNRKHLSHRDRSNVDSQQPRDAASPQTTSTQTSCAHVENPDTAPSALRDGAPTPYVALPTSSTNESPSTLTKTTPLPPSINFQASEMSVHQPRSPLSSQPAPQERDASLMPPPSLPAQGRSLRAPPTLSTNTSLRVPTNGPLPNRGPPQRSSNTLLTPSNARLPGPSSTARKKVLLSPGHSPLDWASLQSSGKNLAGVPHLLRVTPSQLAEANGRKGRPAWSAWQGKVYNIEPYLPFHPGGKGELMRAAGKGGEVVKKLFDEVHPWVNWENMLGACVVGILVGEQEGAGLDEMD